MKKNEIIEMINELIDGTLDENKKEEIKKELQSNAEAQKYFEDLTKMNSLLAADSEKKAEIDITGMVLGKIDKEMYSPEPKKRSFWDAFGFTYSNNFRYAAMFSVGILVGLVVYTTAFKTGVVNLNSSEYSGTLTDVSKPVNFNKGESIRVDNNGVKAVINSYFQNDLIIAEIKVKTDESVSLNFAFNDQNLKVYALKTLNLKEESNIISGKGIIQITSKGENTYVMMFKNYGLKKENIDVNIYSGVTKVYNSSFIAN